MAEVLSSSLQRCFCFVCFTPARNPPCSRETSSDDKPTKDHPHVRSLSKNSTSWPTRIRRRRHGPSLSLSSTTKCVSPVFIQVESELKNTSLDSGPRRARLAVQAAQEGRKRRCVMLDCRTVPGARSTDAPYPSCSHQDSQPWHR